VAFSHSLITLEKDFPMSSIESASASNSFSGMFAPLASVAANYLQDKMHKKMDGDGDGMVNKSEFQSALEQVGAKLGVDTGGDVDGMFASVDANSDGSLTGSEVGQMLKNMFAPASNTDAFVQTRGDEQRFAELDADGDGNISMAEFGIGSTSNDSMAADTTYTSDEALAAADSSATAPLNEDAMQALLGQVDSDADGQLSGEEISAFVTKLGTQMQAASSKYNSTALASFSTNQLNTAA
jgi:Ca2+-binding EF-hand superfamily protein